MSEPILVADIGGTNARFALADGATGALTVRNAQVFRAEDFESIRDAADAYLEAARVKPAIACFAVAGPVNGAHAAFTNSSWALNAREMKKALSLKYFRVVNDFEALATGLSALKKEDFLSVRTGAGDAHAPVLVMGPGTGLGQALVVPCGAEQRVIPTEGGHVSFAPRTDEEIAVMKFIMKEHGRVSVERILSGRGIVNLHRALCAINGAVFTPMRADEITAAALSGDNELAQRAVNLFCECLGRVAGDGVLGTGARGGVVLGGGILPKIREFFMKSAFVERFLDKGRMRYYVENVPVRIVVTDGAALAGAAVLAGKGCHEY